MSTFGIPSASGSEMYSLILSSFKFDYPKWGTYFSLVTETDYIVFGLVATVIGMFLATYGQEKEEK